MDCIFEGFKGWKGIIDIVVTKGSRWTRNAVAVLYRNTQLTTFLADRKMVTPDLESSGQDCSRSRFC